MNKLTAIVSLSVALLLSMTAACGGENTTEEKRATTSNLEGDYDNGNYDNGNYDNGNYDNGNYDNYDRTNRNDNRDYENRNNEGGDSERGAAPAGYYAGTRCYNRCLATGSKDCDRCWGLN